MSNEIRLNTKELDALIKAFKGPLPKARVGVLGDKNARTGTGEKTNAEIGAKHEFGSDGMPIRSFLRMPLTEKLQDHLEKSGAFDKDAIKKVVKEKTIADYVNRIGIVAVQVVLEAFNTGGFGKWKPSNMERKKVKQTLVETQQLRNSITYEVVE